VRVGGARPTPFHSIYHHVQSLDVRSSWEGRYPSPISPLPIYVLCGRAATFPNLLFFHHLLVPRVDLRVHLWFFKCIVLSCSPNNQQRRKNFPIKSSKLWITSFCYIYNTFFHAASSSAFFGTTFQAVRLCTIFQYRLINVCKRFEPYLLWENIFGSNYSEKVFEV
jgi:hypothetical protein